MEFTMESAFWVFNMVSNYAYTRYSDMYPEIEAVQKQLHNEFIAGVAENDKKMEAMLKTNPAQVTEELNKFSNDAAVKTHKRWTELYAYLFTKYMDGNVKTAQPVPANYKYVAPEVKQPKLPEQWYRMIVSDTGDEKKMIGGGH
jgi:dipeptidase